MSAALNKEVATLAAIGPFDQSPFGDNTFLSPLNSVPKKGSQDHRLILDLSYPRGNSINDGIDKDWYLGEFEKMALPSVDNLAERIMKLGPGAKLFKIDLSWAYRQIFLDPGDINWVGYKYNGKWYFNTTLSMGSKSSAKCCQRVTSAVVFIFSKWNYFAINYLDDIGGAESAEKAEEAFENLKKLLHNFGLKIATGKSVAPTTVMVFLGIEVNTILLTLSIPRDKWEEIKSELNRWAQKKTANLNQVQKLAGLLNFACRCVKSGKIYLSRILNFLRSLPKEGFRQIPTSVKHDISWWLEFAPLYNRTTLTTQNWWLDPDAILSSDSYLTGGGCFFRRQFYTLGVSTRINTKTF